MCQKNILFQNLNLILNTKMGGAASLIPGGAASLIPEQIDIDSFRILSGDKFIQEVFDSLKDDKGFISQSLLLDLNSVNSRLPLFKEAVTIFSKLILSYSSKMLKLKACDTRDT